MHVSVKLRRIEISHMKKALEYSVCFHEEPLEEGTGCFREKPLCEGFFSYILSYQTLGFYVSTLKPLCGGFFFYILRYQTLGFYVSTLLLSSA